MSRKFSVGDRVRIVLSGLQERIGKVCPTTGTALSQSTTATKRFRGPNAHGSRTVFAREITCGDWFRAGVVLGVLIVATFF